MAVDGQATLQVPVVNIARLVALKSDQELNAALKNPDVPLTEIIDAIRAAATEWGFFYISNHGIAPEKIQALRSITRDFFALPKEVKNSTRRTPENHLGYFDSELTKNKTDWKEVFDYSGQHREADVPADGSYSLQPLASNVWLPEETLPGFKQTLREHYDTTEQIARRLLKVFAVALGKTPEFFDQFFYNGDEVEKGSSASMARLNYYPVAPEPGKTMGVYHHTDIVALTVLLQDDNVATLQVFHRKEQKWVFVPPIKDTFVINIGDSTQVWSNDKFVAPLHRVLATSEGDRYSIPLFYGPLFSANIEPIVVQTDEKPKYRPFNYGEFVLERAVGDYKDVGEEVQISHFRIEDEESP